MADHELLRSQKNKILRLIQDLDLEPINFSWSYISSAAHRVPKLSYLNSEYYFTFDLNNRGEHYCSFSPSNDKLIDVVFTKD